MQGLAQPTTGTTTHCVNSRKTPQQCLPPSRTTALISFEPRCPFLLLDTLSKMYPRPHLTGGQVFKTVHQQLLQLEQRQQEGPLKQADLKEQPQQSLRRVPLTLAWRKLHAWRSMAGCTAVTEVVMRFGHHLRTPQLIVSSYCSFAANLALQLDAGSSVPWQSYISLASTLFKCVSMPPTENSAESQSPSMTPVMYAVGMKALHAAIRSVQGFILQSHATSCTKARQLEPKTAAGGHMAPAMPFGAVGSTPDDDHVVASTLSDCTRQKVSSVADSHLECGSGYCESAQQLWAVLVLTLVRVCIRSLRRDKSAVADMEFGRTLLHMARTWTTQDTDLANLDSLLVQLSDGEELLCDDRSTMREEADVWGRYAFQHFHGRMLPGCGCLSCYNLAGPSEAALPTLLCGGCRRVRYCCVTCQREAWVEGGHSSICQL